MNRKHLISWILTLVMLVTMSFTSFAAAQETAAPPAGQETETPVLKEEPLVPAPENPGDTVEAAITTELGVQEGTRVVVGATTMMTGYFGLGIWGDNASDSDVRELIHGYETVSWSRELGMHLNDTVVEGVDVMENRDGTGTFTIELKEGLSYNDGSPLTSKDYAFSLLLLTSPELQDIGGTYGGMEHLVGYTDYHTGRKDILSGVKLVSDTVFTMDVEGEFLPHYFGLNLINVQPYPISVIAPGCEVMDDGDGVYLGAISGIAPEETKEGYIYGEFSPDMLRHTLLNPETGYEFHPYLTCGPYTLDSFDPEKQEANFVVNTHFLGNYQGQKPHIERLVFKQVDKDTMLDEFAAGELDVVARISENSTITRGREMQSEGANMKVASYPRSGLAFLAFACEDGPTASEAVRQAISISFDKPSLVAETVGNHAVPAYGYYGIGQWMTEYVVEEFIPEEGEEIPEDMVILDPIDMPAELAALETRKNLKEAKELLEGDGWKLNKEGETFVEGEDDIRYRKEKGELVPLTIHWALPTESAVADSLQGPLTEALNAIGIDVQATVMPFNELLNQYYRTEERTYNMFFMASNFNFLFDPYYDFSTDEAYQGVINKTGLEDETLFRLSRSLRNTEAGDNDTYARKWLKFQKRFAEMLPVIPLYSNNYYDFYNGDMQDYQIDQRSGWSLGIIYVWILEADSIVG